MNVYASDNDETIAKLMGLSGASAEEAAEALEMSGGDAEGAMSLLNMSKVAAKTASSLRTEVTSTDNKVYGTSHEASYKSWWETSHCIDDSSIDANTREALAHAPSLIVAHHATKDREEENGKSDLTLLYEPL